MSTAYNNPLGYLPPELWTGIFELVVVNDFDHPNHPSDPPAVQTMSQVCRSWRLFADSAPSLWSVLRIHHPDPSSVQEDILLESEEDESEEVGLSVDAAVRRTSRWLALSSPLPFHLQMTLPSDYQKLIGLLQLPGNIDRLQRLHLILPASGHPFIYTFSIAASDIQHSFPFLECFRLQLVNRERLEVHGLGAASFITPYFKAHPLPSARGWNESHRQRLTRFHLNAILDPLYTVQILLDAAPGLVECTLELWHWDSMEDTPPIVLPCLKVLNVTSFQDDTSPDFLSIWEMPKLETLVVRGREEPRRSDVQETPDRRERRREALKKLASPSSALTSVTFDTVELLDKDDIFLFIRTCPSLSHLTLRNLTRLVGYYPLFFEGFPHLSEGRALKRLSIGVVIANQRYDSPQTFAPTSFVSFAATLRDVSITLQLIGLPGDPQNLAENLRSDIRTELARCEIDEELSPTVDVVHARRSFEGMFVD